MFRSWVGPVERLPQEYRLRHIATQTRQRLRISNETRTMNPHDSLDTLSDQFDPIAVSAYESIQYLRPGVQKSVLRKLKKSAFRPVATLDLHGMTVPVAHQAVATFIMRNRRAQYCCVRIIHGKGLRTKQDQPILKRKVNHWLRHREDILAFTSAPSRDGGTGALYVLIRSQK